MYIHRSVLLLFIFIYLIVLLGLDWVNAREAGWYRPYMVGLAIIALAAWLQHSQHRDDF